MDTALFLIGGGGRGWGRESELLGVLLQISHTHKRPGLLSVRAQASKMGVIGRQGSPERAGAMEGAWRRRDNRITMLALPPSRDHRDKGTLTALCLGGSLYVNAFSNKQ